MKSLEKKRLFCVWEKGMPFTKTIFQLAMLSFFLVSCADLRIAKTEFDNQYYQSARVHWAVLAQKGFPQAEVGLGRLLVIGQENKTYDEQVYQEALGLFYSAYEKGHVTVAYDIGKTHLKQAKQTGITEQYQEAYLWLGRASAAGRIGADIHLADMELDGLGTEHDTARAITRYKNLATAGLAKAANRLGGIYFQGVYVTRNEQQALYWYQQAIALGDVAAEFKLAQLYETAQSDIKDLKRAMNLYEKLAKNGNVAAAYKLARLIEDSESTNAGTPGPSALHWYIVAAEQQHALSLLRLARIKLENSQSSGSNQEALATYQQLSEQGVGAASFYLGLAHEKGLGTPQNDQLAFKWYAKSFEQNYSRAELRLARLYVKGNGVTQDLKTARDIYLRFAQQGDVNAAYQLAELLKEAGDSGQARQWYAFAAKNGHLSSRYALGIMLSQSSNRQDAEEAERQLTEASAQGFHPATLYLGEKIFYGWNEPENKIRGLSLVLKAARHNTPKAVNTAVILMDQMSDVNSIALANTCSKQVLKEMSQWFLCTDKTSRSLSGQ